MRYYLIGAKSAGDWSYVLDSTDLQEIRDKYRKQPGDIWYHVLRDDKNLPKNVPPVQLGESENDGYAPDRSCNPERCDCNALGFPVMSSPGGFLRLSK